MVSGKQTTKVGELSGEDNNSINACYDVVG